MKRNMIEAINLALHDVMSQDETTLLIGEDVGVMGGVFRATQGLQEAFGPQRVLDMPISESLLAGMAFGMAYQGYKPIVEFQFMGFMYAALEQIISHLSRIQTRTQGVRRAPVLIRMPFGAGVKAPEHHSESLEALLAHVPHLHIAIPSTPSMAYAHIHAAMKHDGLSIILEHKALYRRHSEIIDTSNVFPSQAKIISQGDDLTLIAWGSTVHLAKKYIEQSSLSIELIDLNIIKPLDLRTLVNAVNRTGRCVILQESTRSFSVSSEISACLHEHCLMSLQAPIIRLTAPDQIVPPGQFEHFHLPSIQKLHRAIEECMS